jgi:hypothetical protein
LLPRPSLAKTSVATSDENMFRTFVNATASMKVK